MSKVVHPEPSPGLASNGHPDAEPSERPTGFGHGVDQLARAAGGWPEDYAVFAVAVLNPEQHGKQPPEKIFVRLTGARPTGANKHGYARWAKTKRLRQDRDAIVTLADYRAAYDIAEPTREAGGRTGGQSPPGITTKSKASQ